MTKIYKEHYTNGILTVIAVFLAIITVQIVSGKTKVKVCGDSKWGPECAQVFSGELRVDPSEN